MYLGSESNQPYRCRCGKLDRNLQSGCDFLCLGQRNVDHFNRFGYDQCNDHLLGNRNERRWNRQYCKRDSHSRSGPTTAMHLDGNAFQHYCRRFCYADGELLACGNVLHMDKCGCDRSQRHRDTHCNHDLHSHRHQCWWRRQYGFCDGNRDTSQQRRLPARHLSE